MALKTAVETTVGDLVAAVGDRVDSAVSLLLRFDRLASRSLVVVENRRPIEKTRI